MWCESDFSNSVAAPLYSDIIYNNANYTFKFHKFALTVALN